MNNKQQLKIFIVDDDLFYLNILERHVSTLGYQKVTTYDNGTDCLNHLDKKPDIILLDYGMDNLTGFDVLKKIKRFDPDIYVVMISGQEEIKPAVDSLKYGAFDYIQKGESDKKNIEKVLDRIFETKNILKKSDPNFIKKLFQFL